MYQNKLVTVKQYSSDRFKRQICDDQAGVTHNFQNKS